MHNVRLAFNYSFSVEKQLTIKKKKNFGDIELAYIYTRIFRIFVWIFSGLSDNIGEGGERGVSFLIGEAGRGKDSGLVMSRI